MARRGQQISSYVFLVIIILAILMLGINGCPPAKKVEGPAALGLSMAFLENAPPSQIVVNQPFSMYLDIKNIGEQEISAGKAKFFLSGVSGANFQGIVLEKTNAFSLAKKTAVFEGGSERVVFAESAKFISPLTRAFQPKFIVTSCYDYATTAEAFVCIGKGNEICNATGEKITATSNSIAPVQVTSLKQAVVGNKLQILVTIQNKGQGEIYSPDADCNKLQEGDFSELAKENTMAVSVKTEEPGFACNLISNLPPYNIQALTGLTRMQFSCEKDISAVKGSYPVPFKIILQYKYHDSIEKTITIMPA